MPKDHAHGAACRCAACETQAYTRNNYFTGKLMVERDFTDEQTYVREKDRIHNQRLHGTGIVCGLKIRAHDEPCDDRYVILEPGTAIDCCGQDILVAEEEVIDLQSFPAMQDLLAEAEDPDTPDDRTWDLQLCIRYAECPTEDVPVLYDECGCDDSRCAPNRILESYQIDLLVDPEIVEHDPLMPGFDWAGTIGVDESAIVVVDPTRSQAFVSTSGPDSVLHQVNTSTLAIEASLSLGREVLAMDLSNSGAEVFVSVADAGGVGAGDAELLVFDVDAANLSAGADRTLPVPGSQNSGLWLRTLPDGRLLALTSQGGALRLWDASVNAAPAELGELDPAAAFLAPVVLSDGVRIVAPVQGAGTLHQVDLSTPGPDMTTIALAEGVSDGIALVGGGTADRLASIDASANGLRLLDLSGVTLGSAALDHMPGDLVVTQGGVYAYVLVADSDSSFVQAVALAPLKSGGTGTASEPYPIGERSLSLHRSGSRLWIPYLGADDAAATGGVSVLEIQETDCHGLLFQDGCPGCECGDCLVLATIQNYRPGDRLLDMPELPGSTEEGTAHINNLLGRKRLPSTQAIAEALQCLMDNCCDGERVDPLPTPDPAPEPTPDPEPDPGSGPPPFEPPEVTRICAISWPHFGVADQANFPTVPIQFGDSTDPITLPGFVIAFDGQTNMHASIPPQIHAAGGQQDYARYLTSVVKLRVGLIGDAFSPVQDPDYTLWADVPMVVAPVEVSLTEHDPATGTCKIEDVVKVVNAMEDPTVTGSTENGLLAVPFANISAEGLRDLFYRQIINTGTVNVPKVEQAIYRFELIFDGNMLLDIKGNPIDAEHVAPFLPNRGTGDAWPGGVFKSTFFFNAPPTVPGIDVQDLMFNSHLTAGPVAESEDEVIVGLNSASAEELIRLKRVGPDLAAAIIAARPLRNEKDLLAVNGIGPALLSSIRKSVNFD